MLPAAKHLDIVVGVDIHIVMIPTPGGPVPTPIPHPFIGMIFDSGDYNFAAMAMQAAAGMGVDLSPAMDAMGALGAAKSKMPGAALQAQLEKLKNLGKSKLGITPPPSGPATVKVNGLPRARAGTKGKATVPHFPIGGPAFQKGKLPDTCESFMGSLTVLADGEPFSFMGCLALSCNCIGMPVPSRKKGSKQSGTFLPVSTIISIPLGQLVLVGGPPVPSLNLLLNKLFDKAFAAALAKLKKVGMKAISALMHGIAGKLMKKLGIKASTRNAVHRMICKATGHPVDVATGKVFTEASDFELPGPIPLEWERVWFSTSDYEGSLGHGWHWKYDLALVVDEESGVSVLRMADGRPAIFPPLKVGENEVNKFENLTLSRSAEGYLLRDKEGVFYRFGQPTVSDGSLLFPLLSVEDAASHAIRFAYDHRGRLTQIKDSAGRILKVQTNARGAITAVEAPHPEHRGDYFTIVAYHYDERGNLVEVLDALKQPFRYEYEGHLLTKETNRNGMSFYFQYDGKDSEAWCLRTWGDGGIYDHKLEYHREEKFTIVEDSLGRRSKYHWNDKGLVWKSIDPLGKVSLQRYTAQNQILAEIDELGLVTSYGYDPLGNQTSIAYPDGSVMQMEYEDGLLTAATDQNGGKWQWRYNAQRLLTRRIDPMGGQTQFAYENGQLKSITDPAGGVTTVTFDKQLNLASMTSPDSATSRWEYDALGRCTEAIDPKGNVQKRKHNLIGWVRRVNEPDGNERELEYDHEGNILRAKDHHHDVRFEYAGMNRLKARTEAGTRVEFKYDTEENLLGIINEHGYAYRFELDANDEVLTESGFDGITRRYLRDAAGRVVEVKRAGGISTQYEYDPMSRVTAVLHSDGSTERFAYRPDGELMEAINDHITVKFERDALGRVTKEAQGGFIVESKYDVLGMRTSVGSSLGASLSFGRNGMGDVETVSATGEGKPWEASFKRDLAGLEIERLLPGGVRSEWKRDRLGRPVEQKTFAAGGKLSRSKQYVWDVNDRLKKIIDGQKGTVSFEHDAFGNLASAQYGDGSFEFRMPDAVGNLFRSKDQKDRKYGPAGQLLESNGTRYEYDPEGNLLKKTAPDGSVWRYDWNAAGMLRRVTRPDGDEVLFTYDALGRRISKQYRGKVTRWVWDGNVMLHEWAEISRQGAGGSGQQDGGEQPGGLIKIRRRDAQLATAPANAPPSPQSLIFNPQSLEDLTTWVFEPDTFAPLAKLKGGQQFSIVSDHLGTPAAMFNGTGEKVWEMDLSIYGQPRDVLGWREACPFRYPGQYEDVETGLYYNRFRYYDAEGGMYLAQDPIGLLGGFSLYSYVEDSLKWTDPLGLAKRGPKTDKNAPHNKTISDWGDEIAAEHGEDAIIAGGGRQKETTVDIPGGNKGKRRPDIIWKDKDGNIHYGNVGKTNAKGKPVPREIKAMRDLNKARKAQGMKGRTQFRSYTHPRKGKKTYPK